MKVGDRVEFTNEAGVKYSALVMHVHRVDDERSPLDLVHVDANVNLPNGPSVPIQRFAISHKNGVFVSGKPYWVGIA